MIVFTFDKKKINVYFDDTYQISLLTFKLRLRISNINPNCRIINQLGIFLNVSTPLNRFLYIEFVNFRCFMNFVADVSKYFV